MTQETKLTFWGGLDTIGGNIVSIEFGEHRIITDFGALSGVNIDTLLKSNVTGELLKNKQLPAIPGIYPKNSLGECDLLSFEDSSFETIICLSHLHLDHLGSFAQLPPSMPVYALDEAINTYHCLDKHHLLPHYKVNWQSVQPEQLIEFGAFKIKFYDSDHDTPGAASIFIETPDLKIVYSGDFRLTGFHPEKVVNWATHARRFAPDVLLTEGTTFSSFQSEPTDIELELTAITHSINAPNEKKLMRSVKELLHKFSNELFAFNGYPQNIDRLIELGKIATQMGRTLVLDEAYYDLLLPHISELIDIRKLSLNDAFGEELISLEELHRSPQKYVLQVDYERHQHLFDLPGGVYLHSNGMPLGLYMPEYEPYVRKVVESGWLFYHANVSGHASTTDLLSVAYIIQPAIVVPWHTFNPVDYASALEEIGSPTWLPDYHKVYDTTQIKQLIKSKGE